MSILGLVRDDIRDFAGYRSARSDKLDGAIWLNANESPWANAADGNSRLRRYPEPQPQRLRETLASLYGCLPQQLLAGRGSDEGIDLLLRALCRPGGDTIVITTPTFGMYAVCARLHGTRVVDVPLREDVDGYACDFTAVGDAAERESAKRASTERRNAEYAVEKARQARAEADAKERENAARTAQAAADAALKSKQKAERDAKYAARKGRRS